jgi:hypothetical protein
MESPIGEDDPEKGPVTAILMGSAACPRHDAMLNIKPAANFHIFIWYSSSKIKA